MKFKDVSFFVENDWEARNKSTRLDLFKEFVYFIIRPLLSAYTARNLTQETREKFNPAFVSAERGIPFRARRRWTLNLCGVKEPTVLIQGVGTGWEAILWARTGGKKSHWCRPFQLCYTWNKMHEFL